jgi:hypothetical protein
MNEMELEHAPVTTEACEMAIVYDDGSARERAMYLCDRLATQFHKDPQFEFSWWNIRYLNDPQVAELAARVAARADLLLFSSSRGEPPTELKRWVKAWLPRRRGHGGALVTWVNRSAETVATQLELYLKGVAQEGEMDYVPLVDPAAA